MKTTEELNTLKAVENKNNKLHELTDDELTQVTGGAGLDFYVEIGEDWDEKDFEARFISGQGNENVNINQSLQTTEDPIKEKGTVIQVTHF